MKFNNDKFQLLQFGKDENLMCQYNYLSPDQSDIITPNFTVSDLGVTFNRDGNFNDHIMKIVSKAKQRIGLIMRTFLNRDISFLKFAWRNYIQPIIENGIHT